MRISVGTVCTAIVVGGVAPLARAQDVPPPIEPRPQVVDTPAPKHGPESPRNAQRWWNDRVFYEIFLRSYKDAAQGPLAGDGIGDINGLIEKLDYLNDRSDLTDFDLQIGCIWLMPMQPSPSYHGYDVTDYQGVNPQYGTLEDMKKLVVRCHEHDIGVVVDHVMNHTSNRHPWFLNAIDPASPTHDWFVWSKDKPAWKGPWNQDVWHRVGDAPGHSDEQKAFEQYYYGLFSPYMPDLNYRNPDATKAMYDATKFWLEEVGVDGLRLDAVRHLVEEGQQQQNTSATHAWLRDWYAMVKEVKPKAMTVGEVWDSSDVASQYVGDQMDLVFEFELAAATIRAINEGHAAPLSRALDKALALYPRNQFATFLSNHDQPRVATQLLSGGDAANRLAACLLLTGPGVPFIYYGEEIGMVGDKPDENIRTPMQWSGGTNAGFTTATPWHAVNPDRKDRNLAIQHADRKSLVSLYRTLIRVRSRYAALRRGDTRVLSTGDDTVYACLRTYEDEGKEQSVLILANVSATPVEGYNLTIDAAHLARFATTKEVLWDETTEEIAPYRIDGQKSIRPIRSLKPRTLYVVVPADDFIPPPPPPPTPQLPRPNLTPDATPQPETK